MTKRKLEVSDYSLLEEELPSADVHGVITNLSPVKKSRTSANYYDGELSDGKHSIRFVGFSTAQKQVLDDFAILKKPVLFKDCQLKKSLRDSSVIDIILKSKSLIMESENKFDVPQWEFKCLKPIDIFVSDVNETDVNSIVSLTVKAILAERPISIGPKRLQYVVVSDHTGTTKVQLWEENIGLLVDGNSYNLESFRITVYDGTKYLALQCHGSRVTPSSKAVEAVEPIISDRNVVDVENPKVAAVIKLDTIRLCMFCKSRAEPGSPPYGRCTECRVLLNYEMCDISTISQVMFLINSQFLTLNISGSLVRTFAKTEEPTDVDMMRANIASLSYDSDTKEILKFVHK